MPQWAENKTYSQVFHDGQMQHYALRSGAPPAPEPQMSSSMPAAGRGRVPQRNPVASSSQHNQQASSSRQHHGHHTGTPPISPGAAAVPARKPVGGSRPQPAASSHSRTPSATSGASRTHSPAGGRVHSPAAANRRPHGAPDLNKELPKLPGGERVAFIGRQDGDQFSYFTRGAGASAPTTPVSPLTRPAPRFPTTPVSPSTRPTPSTPTTPSTPKTRPTPSRPGSSGGWSFKGRKRANSNLSAKNPEAGSRRGSLSEAAKSAGKWVKGKSDILTMNKTQRDAFVAGTQLAKERELELARQSNLAPRPVHQQQYLVAKQRAARPGESWGLGPAAASYEAQMEERAFRDRHHAQIKKHHEEACAQALMEGKPRPNSPDLSGWTPPAASLKSEEREEAFNEAQGHGPSLEERAKFAASDRFVLKFSELLDPFKRERQGSDGSDMDFGMTDTAPAEAMYVCGEAPEENFGKGCHMPSSSFLKAGLCDKCYAVVKHAEHPTAPRIKGHNPKSPEDDARGGVLYIRLTDQHRLRRVRNTLYEDPGNPFDEPFDPAVPPVLSTSTATSKTDDEETDNSIFWNHWEEGSHAGLLPRADKETLSVLSDPFDLATTDVCDSLTPPDRFSPLRISTSPPLDDARESFDSERRSMSVDIGFLPMQSFGGGYIAVLQENGMPSFHVQHPSGTIDPRRNSEFYEFYDDLLAEYGIEAREHGRHARDGKADATYGGSLLTRTAR